LIVNKVIETDFLAFLIFESNKQLILTECIPFRLGVLITEHTRCVSETEQSLIEIWVTRPQVEIHFFKSDSKNHWSRNSFQKKILLFVTRDPIMLRKIVQVRYSWQTEDRCYSAEVHEMLRHEKIPFVSAGPHILHLELLQFVVKLLWMDIVMDIRLKVLVRRTDVEGPSALNELMWWCDIEAGQQWKIFLECKMLKPMMGGMK